MKKVVFFHLFNDRSGGPKVLSQVIGAYRNANFHTELVTSKHEDGFLTNCAHTTRHSFYGRSENKILTLIWFLVSQCHIFFLCLRYFNRDVVFYVNTMMPVSAGIAGRLLGKKVIFHVHETSINPIALKRVLRFFIERTAHQVIFVSKYLSEIEGFKKPWQDVIYNGIEKPTINAGRKYLENDQGFHVLMVCSVKKYKGVLEYIALSKMLSHMRFTLVLNASRFEINKIFKSWNVEIPPNLDIHARQSDISGFYLKSSVVLNFSRPDSWVETFGLTILEAMSYGKPVIVPTVGGPAEIVDDGVQGYCISCYDLKAVKNALIDLSCDKKLYQSMSVSALERSKDFAVDKFQHNVLKLQIELWKKK